MWIRTVEVIVGALRFFGDGGNEGFRIQFTVSKSILGYPNTATITITNLKNDTIDQLLKKGLPVELSIGHADTGIVRLFKGDLQSTIPSRAGTERETVIQCLDGGSPIAYSKGQKVFDITPVADIVEYLASDVMGLDIGKIDVDGETGFKGRVVAGSAKRELDDLAREFKFSWSVQDGEFFAIHDDKVIPVVWEMSRATGLQSAKQVFSGPYQTENGVELQALINPRMFPNHVIDLIWNEGSDFPAGIAGKYKVHNMNFFGSTHDNDWTMNLQSYKYGGF